MLRTPEASAAPPTQKPPENRSERGDDARRLDRDVSSHGEGSIVAARPLQMTLLQMTLW